MSESVFGLHYIYYLTKLEVKNLFTARLGGRYKFGSYSYNSTKGNRTWIDNYSNNYM